jgi:F0F1-type ATP synthase assembly protein I
MTKLAAIKTTKDEKVREAKRAFILSLFDLSWRLLGAMLAPLFIGLYIDSKRDHGQAFALTGFVIGMICGALVLRSVVKKIAQNGGGTK